ncbi:undecaprenyldiphospho-muramoylpentapeptide beta-N-acetylglucosaminyltransferase [Snodgrassella sp. B3800]|uniref:undecaprenyldiphospho-muramoylpentapeptide beta-N-acetylglucosaminyltransferase n=1 Tax=Snodgrassella sp. B3800 TaxID=2818039 RepID=UPI00226AB451|nr:undecaprenyldiphospho-muramoylpentapeptide beta-N-acetylglucosaminyltransferase [Snodgrassella sp. B3800]MCX8746767.1 undecaprenyldiphospho-muramoylpentapeptide beta-N-acetylglucosaminyltransferase [Snodgrassella sp. B3800]
MNSKTFMVMAGGTGGHIFPALAVAQELQAQGHRIVWLGSEGAMETRLVPQYNIPLETLSIKGIRGNGIKRKLLLPFTLVKTIAAARRIILRYNVDAVIGFGGFVSFPGGIAARLCGLPLIVHEQNAIAGLSNKVLSHFASQVMYAFPQVFTNQNGLVGNPVRADIAALTPPAQRFAGRQGVLNILVVGGSLGADILNKVVPQAMALLPESQRPNLLHQSGRNKLTQLQHQYAECGVKAECVEFITDMVSAYREADLVICRAGALTIAELTAAGLGAILVPYPHAVDDHQTANAQYMVKDGAAVLMPQTSLNAQSLQTVLADLSREQCLQMAEKARALAQPDSAAKVAAAAVASVL